MAPLSFGLSLQLVSITLLCALCSRAFGEKPALVSAASWQVGAAGLNATSSLHTAGAAVVAVRISQRSRQPSLDQKKMGGYRSEEDYYWQSTYNPATTLKPLNLVANRFQIKLDNGDVDSEGNFQDGSGSQRGILRKIAASVASDILVTVGFPATTKARAFLEARFPAGWEDYWSRVYSSLAASLSKVRLPKGRKVWIEILSEPDLPEFAFAYGDQEAVIFRAAQIAHDAFAPYRAQFEIGGCGVAAPENGWLARFMAFYKQAGMQFSFFSYHQYLYWTDATDPSGYPFPGFFNLHDRDKAFRDILRAAGVPDSVPGVVTELAWASGNAKDASGFGDPSKSARFTMTHHQACARTLQVIDVVVQAPLIKWACWAQGAGVEWRLTPATPNLYAFFPAVVYMPDEGKWRYKASYYALWMYGQLRGLRVVAEVGDPALGVWATKYRKSLRVVIWNRSPSPRWASLALPDVPPRSRCKLYLVDSATYQPSGQGEWAAVTGPTSLTPPQRRAVRNVGDALRFLSSKPLKGEATVYLDIVRT